MKRGAPFFLTKGPIPTKEVGMYRKMVIALLVVVFLIASSVPALAEPMFKVHYKDVPTEPVVKKGFVQVRARYLITEKQGAKNFAMRLFEFAPGGHTSYHTHPWEHEIFVKKGRGILVSEGKQHAIEQGDVIFIPSEEPHQFKNESNETLELICLIPLNLP